MIDLTQYKELMKCKKQMTKIEKECEKQFRKEFRENPDMTMDRRHEILQPYYDIKDNVYTKMLYDIFIDMNPIIIEHRTGEQLKFLEVFGKNYEILDNRYKLQVYLMAEESSIMYKFLDDLKRTDDIIKEGGNYDYNLPVGGEPAILRNGKEIKEGYMFGLPYNIYRTTPNEDLKDYYEMWENLSPRGQARYMNEKYGMNYNLNDFPDDDKIK